MKKNDHSNAEMKFSKKNEFEKLVKANMKRAYFVALGFLGSHDAAMDASQEAFIRAYRNFDKYDRNKKFFTWYYKILKNFCLNVIRNNKNRKEDSFLEYEQKYINSAETENDILKKEEKEKLEEALMQLNYEDREIIILKEFENYSYKEIAEIIDLPIGSVMSRLFYARKKLALKLKGFYDE